jgi:hypothetical protein
MIKYNIVVCCYDKILVNVATYVIPGYVCVCGVSRTTLANTTSKFPEDGVLTPKYVGVILILILHHFVHMLV